MGGEGAIDGEMFSPCGVYLGSLPCCSKDYLTKSERTSPQRTVFHCCRRWRRGIQARGEAASEINEVVGQGDVPEEELHVGLVPRVGGANRLLWQFNEFCYFDSAARLLACPLVLVRRRAPGACSAQGFEFSWVCGVHGELVECQ